MQCLNQGFSNSERTATPQGSIHPADVFPPSPSPLGFAEIKVGPAQHRWAENHRFTEPRFCRRFQKMVFVTVFWGFHLKNYRLKNSSPAGFGFCPFWVPVGSRGAPPLGGGPAGTFFPPGPFSCLPDGPLGSSRKTCLVNTFFHSILQNLHFECFFFAIFMFFSPAIFDFSCIFFESPYFGPNSLL